MLRKRITFTIGGRVQGVNFRSYTQKEATNIGVTGYVTNASDGTVQGEAQGTGAQIKDFVQCLHKGSPASRITSLDIEDIAPTSDETSFIIK